MTNLAPLPKPAFIEDNPVMQVAFRDFMNWAIRQPDIIAQFEAESGRKWRPAPIEAMIDKATGHNHPAETAHAFAAWAIVQLWGAEGDSRMDDVPS